MELSPVEENVLSMIRRRLEHGRKEYGKLDDNLHRNFQREALEEALDMAVYLSIALQSYDDLLVELDELLGRVGISDVSAVWQSEGVVAVPMKALLSISRIRSRIGYVPAQSSFLVS